MERRSLKRLSLPVLKTCVKSGPFAPRALPRFLTTMSRSDSRPRPSCRYGFRHAVASSPTRHAGSPRTLPCSVAACPPHSPRTARCVRVLVASAPIAGFSTVGRLAAAMGFTRPYWVRLRWARAFALVAWERLAQSSADWTDSFHALGYPPAPSRSYMSNEQFTWLTPRSQQEQVGFTWHNRRDDALRGRLRRLPHKVAQRSPRPQRRTSISSTDCDRWRRPRFAR